VTAAPEPRRIPLSLKLAALCFALFALAVVFNSVTQFGAGWLVFHHRWWMTRQIAREAFRVVGAGAVAWGLFRGARWAWVLGLILGSFWLVGDLLTVIVFERHDLEWLAPSGFQMFLFAALGCLGAAIVLLLSPSARVAVRPPHV
jgi:hypothetical protein